VILWNERGELTESTRANVCVRCGDAWYTPPVECGLLPGVMRAELLREGRIREARLTLAGLHAADEIALINSVRGWMQATLADAPAQPAATA
jgi:branched-subunit amino acid aminotransferase/4-amino-4-deoxychorismate lyase